jgi:signal transduction histidine kinase
VRENILSLRTTLADEKGLLLAVREYLDEFGIQTGVKTQLTIEEEVDKHLSSIAEVQLVCILQEALANVRKHAEAESVNLSINWCEDLDGEYVEMQVIDDGKGFTIEDSKRRFGLHTMRERASSVGGELVVDSVIGKGTTITCRIPCLNPGTISSRSPIFS